MPVIFIGHGSPMNAIAENIYSRSWRKIGESLPTPRTILAISAHWTSHGETLISKSAHPSMIYDVYGFPPELYQVQYPAPWEPSIAKIIQHLIPNSRLVDRWIDHGVWSVLIHMFPDANIPVVSMSIDISTAPEELLRIGEQLKPLRDQWVLIFGNGNIVHNLMHIDWSNNIQHTWAIEFDKRIASLIDERNLEALSKYRNWWDITSLAHPSEEHLLPIFSLIGATEKWERASHFTPYITLWSLSMRSILWKE